MYFILIAVIIVSKVEVLKNAEQDGWWLLALARERK
jgi:hypothetical protein